MILKPRSVLINGDQIHAGDYLHIIGDKLKPVSLTTWSGKQGQGRINIGNYVLISPGVEITAAQKIEIADNCMIAAESIIADSDWHGIYNRLRPFRCTKPICLEENVWIGRRAFIGKGVNIGKNSVVGANSVVCSDVPANVVVAGNPAKVIKQIKPNRRMLKREYLFQKGDYYLQNQLELTKYLAADNTTLHWLKTLVSPSSSD